MRLDSFSSQSTTETVIDRLARTPYLGAAKPLASVVDHLHAIVRETRPTRDQWRGVIGFLTEVGHTSDDQRQEWILLSDILGLSALVEEINSERPEGATRNTIRGPFYRPDAPLYPSGASVSLDGKGEPLSVSGYVTDLDGQPVTGARVETWQANGEGRYENQEPDAQPDFNLRGTFRTDDRGRFHYKAVKPSGYDIPVDGPVGQLLGAIGCPLSRPAHVQFLISKPGFQTLTTHVYDAGDPALHEDAVFSVKEDLVGHFLRIGDEARGASWHLEFTFVMAPATGGPEERQ